MSDTVIVIQSVAETIQTVQTEAVVAQNPVHVVIEDESGGVMPDIANPDDGEVHLTPKASSSGAEGTMFYNSNDDHVYVATE